MTNPMEYFKEKLTRIHQIFKLFGFDPIQLIKSIKGIPFYIIDLFEIKRQKGSDKCFKFGNAYPILNERFSASGIMSGHYFHQDLFVARQIFNNNPKRHIDIGSRIDGFVAHVAVFREIEIIDIREQSKNVKNILFRRADLMKLPEDLIDSCDSISSLHAIEHFGLGRYGDPINYEGHIKAIENISKILKKNGKFYFSVPIGNQRIEFNAHRVFSVNYLLDIFKDKFVLDSISYVDDRGDFHEDIEITQEGINNNFGCRFGCAIFILTKR
jgi:SAM-dependent methyltransferase